MKYEWFEPTLTTTVTAFRWPTKSMLVFQPSRSMIWAVGPELFMAWAETRYWPSGDQLNLRTCVVPPHWIRAREKEKRESAGSSACKQLKEDKKISKAKFSLTSLNGLVMFVSSCQSMVLQTFRLWSSAWEAMYFPTGSHVRPFTSPVCPFKVITISVAYTYKRKFKNAVFDALIQNWIYWYRSQHFLDVIRVDITVFRHLSHT